MVDGKLEKTIEGKTYSIYAKTQKECKEKLKKFKPTLKPKHKKNNTISLYDFACQWLDIYKKKQNTKRNLQNLSKHLKESPKHLNKTN